jgi:elongation of very long chain fatty acids protein 6
MIVEIVVTLVGFYYYSADEETCMIEKENNSSAFTAFCMMYGSYLFLFMQFFVGRYYQIASSKRKAA